MSQRNGPSRSTRSAERAARDVLQHQAGELLAGRLPPGVDLDDVRVRERGEQPRLAAQEFEREPRAAGVAAHELEGDGPAQRREVLGQPDDAERPASEFADEAELAGEGVEGVRHGMAPMTALATDEHG